MIRWEKCAFLFVGLFTAAAQNRSLSLQQTRYSVKPGEPAILSASSDTLDFLSQAASRQVSIAGSTSSGLVVAPNRDGHMVLAASNRLAPGNYTAQITATSASGEVRQSSVSVEVAARVTVPSNSTRNPVVLLNGWETGFNGPCPVANSSSDDFGNLAQYLVSDGVPVVYLFDNCAEDPGGSIEQLGLDLGAFLQTITYDNGTQVPQIDLVGFSLGGLIARSYLAGLQPNESLVPPFPTLVGKLVLIATPNFGSFVAENYYTYLAQGTQSAELIPGSSFLWNLANWNQRSDDLRGVSAIAIAGNAGVYLPSLSSAIQLNSASDGLVSLTSASVGFVNQQNADTRIVPYCHVDPSVFVNSSFGNFLCNAPGIANVTSTSHPTGQIVRSFLAGTTAWQSIGTAPSADPNLATDGGMYFALSPSGGGYVSDVSSATWGTVALTNGGDSNVIYYQDFIAGSGTLGVTSTSLGSFNCGTYTQQPGFFSAVRCKIGAAIFSIGPLTSTIPRLVTGGGTISIAGADLGTQCTNCRVTFTAAGSSASQNLSVKSWSNTSISASLPSGFSGLATITVFAVGGVDSIAVMIGTTTPAISVSPSSLQFTYTSGGSAPAAQTIAISNSGGGTLSWTATPSASWLSVSPSSGTGSANLSISVSASSLAAGSYTGNVQIAASGASNTPVTIAVTLTVQGATLPAPAITSVTNAASYQPGAAPATWISIFGTNLAATTYTWQNSDFNNGALPVTLQNVSVTVDGIPAYVEYVSPTQINALAPDDSNTGPVQVLVNVAGQTSNAASVTLAAFAPAFFTVDTAGHVAALHSDYTAVTTASPAHAGETILLYATGLGATNPVTATGQLVTAPAGLANAPQITIGGVAATVSYAGLVESGTYQLNVVVPAAATGDDPLVATIGGLTTQSGVLLTIGQ